MSQSSLLSFGRYVVIALAVVLLAPYAGCHILTSPPPSGSGAETRELTGKGSRNPRVPLENTQRLDQDSPSSDETALPPDESKTNLSEIENLLREP